MSECFEIANITAYTRRLKSLFPPGERLPTDDALEFYVECAAEIVLNRAFPFGGFDAELKAWALQRYQNILVRIAFYLISKQGADGEKAHSENGISRQYESADVPASMLEQIIPFCKGYSK